MALHGLRHGESAECEQHCAELWVVMMCLEMHFLVDHRPAQDGHSRVQLWLQHAYLAWILCPRQVAEHSLQGSSWTGVVASLRTGQKEDLSS